MTTKEEQIESVKAWLSSMGVNARQLTPEELKVAATLPNQDILAGYIAALWGVDVKKLQEDKARVKALEDELQDILRKKYEEEA